MKILTLNTHSLQEENYEKKLALFIEGVLAEKPDLIAMQEVNQTASAPALEPERLTGQFPVPGAITVRRDNHAARVAALLRQAGIECWWAWLPIKLGYGKYDEGVAIISLGRKIRDIDHFLISRSREYANWRTRAVLGVHLEGLEDWFYTVHMGWWADEAEPFARQWEVLNTCLAAKRLLGPVWLMGDFNAPSCARGESYDRVLECSWQDTWRLAEHRQEAVTVPGVIDGWRDRVAPGAGGMCLDYIFCSHSPRVLTSRVVFNGKDHPVVSDHFGVIIETKGDART